MKGAQRVTPEYVEKRLVEFAEKHRQALVTLGFADKEVEAGCQYLATRFKDRDFKLYGSQPVHLLHAAKRITRFAIKCAIEQCPARKARIARWQADYRDQCAELRKRQPQGLFFSFEAVYAGRLKVNLAGYKQLFRL